MFIRLIDELHATGHHALAPLLYVPHSSRSTRARSKPAVAVLAGRARAAPTTRSPDPICRARVEDPTPEAVEPRTRRAQRPRPRAARAARAVPALRRGPHPGGDRPRIGLSQMQVSRILRPRLGALGGRAGSRRGRGRSPRSEDGREAPGGAASRHHESQPVSGRRRPAPAVTSWDPSARAPRNALTLHASSGASAKRRRPRAERARDAPRDDWRRTRCPALPRPGAGGGADGSAAGRRSCPAIVPRRDGRQAIAGCSRPAPTSTRATRAGGPP